MKRVIAILCAPLWAWACEPCPNLLDVPQSLHRASLVIVANATGYARSGKKPEFDTLEVEGVLKGKYAGKRLRVKAWYGMCDYGITLEKGKYVVLLAEENGNYTAIQNGCGKKAFPILPGGKAAVDDWTVSPKDLIEAGGIPPGRNRHLKTK